MSQELIEAVARALWGAQKDCPKEHFDNLTVPMHLIEDAIAALAAIEASGTHVVVPVEPTADMKRDGFWANVGKEKEADQVISRAWPAMLSARPKVTT